MPDIFDGANEVQVSSISFSKVGDEVVGYFTGNRKDIMTQNGPSVVYEVKGLFGSFHLAETTDDGAVRQPTPPDAPHRHFATSTRSTGGAANIISEVCP